MDNAHDYLQEQIKALTKVLPIQAPLQDFVHFNPLMHYEQLPFADALREVHRLTGAYGYLPQAEYRRFYDVGRITDSDIHYVLQAEPSFGSTEALLPGWRVCDISRMALLYPVRPLNFRQVCWKIEEEQALAVFQPEITPASQQALLAAAAQHGQTEVAAALNALWQASLRTLHIHDEFAHPENVTYLTASNLGQLWQEIKETAHLDEADPDMEQQVLDAAHHTLDKLLHQVGPQTTLRGLLKALTGEDVLSAIRPVLFRQLAQWLDLGMSAHTSKQGGFYAYWKQQALNDHLPGFTELDPRYDYISSLDGEPLAIIEQELMRIGIAKAHWGDYLRSLALELPGWSGMFNWRAQHPGYAQQAVAVDMADYLAVRLVLEHLHCRQLTHDQWNIEASIQEIRGYFKHNLMELLVRYHAWQAHLPEHLQMLASGLLGGTNEEVSAQQWYQLAHMVMTWKLAAGTALPVSLDAYQEAWRLFVLAQQLGLCAEGLLVLDTQTLERLIALIKQLDDADTRGYLWLRAYERHYSVQVFNALLSPEALPKPTQTPEAQLVFCMDDREEAIRRHLEEIAPQIETLGVAGVFGLPNNWRALGASNTLKLAQPVVTAVHEFQEVPDPAEPITAVQAFRQRQQRLRGVSLFKSHTLRQGLLGSAAALPAFGTFALAELLGRSFAPGQYQQLSNRLGERVLRPVKARVQYTASETDLATRVAPSAEHNQLGLTLEEKVGKIATFLKMAGFTNGFARLVCLMAHRARHLNNPHLLAYGCGACSGRFGGPNARAFAGSINEPEVRAELAARHQIHIPPTCWFMAAEHDTSSDQIDWLDVDLLPASHRDDFRHVQAHLAQAAELSAHERCRKFASAPAGLDAAAALRHVQGRVASPDQARAELGHQGCAVAFIGRRSMSQYRFWDRRSFLISYDAAQDPDGMVLESQLLGNGVVGVGISLDYYFSRIQNGYLGSGSKITHNMVGAFGVMEGASSDLRTGLAQQMTELHEPMRLLAVLEAPVALVEAIYLRQPYLRMLLDNAWLLLAVKEPDAAELYEFMPGQGLVRWHGELSPLPQSAGSVAWYAGQADYLPPAWVRGAAT